MKCFNCGFDKINRDHEFCPTCGVEFDKYCESCHNFNPKQSVFCVSCGTKLVEQVENEEKHIKAGVIFADISGFTSLAEVYSPEKTREIINECFDEIAKPIYKYDGIIDKFIGDAVMAVFGSSKESIDTPKNTILCAIEIKKAIKHLNEVKFGDVQMKLDVSIGVSYGDVILGNVGTKLDFDYTVIGDIVNIASRFQNFSAPGEIRVNDELYVLTNQYVVYSSVDEIELKNKKDLVSSYIAYDMKKTKKEDLYIQRSEETLVQNYLSQSQSGVLQIIGESGDGKSMMIKHLLPQYEVISNIYSVELNTVDEKVSYSTIAKLIKNMIGAKQSDSKQRIKEKLQSFISLQISIDIDHERIVEFLSLILKLPRSSKYDSIIQAMNYHDLTSEIKYQWELFANGIGKCIIVVDNGHFMEEKSIALLVGLNQKVVVTTQKSIGDNQEYYSLYMSRFDRNMIMEYFTKYFMTSISDDLIEYVFTWSNGVPYYIKQLCVEINRLSKEYKNNEMIVSEEAMMQIPETIEKLNLLKVDQLDKECKLMLQVASCFQLDFNFLYISNMIEVPYNDDIEDTLLSRGIIQVYSYQRIDNKTYNTYLFTSDELKNNVYNSLLEKRKAEYHNLIANVYYEDSDEYEIKGYHFEQSNDDASAAHMYEEAGHKYHALFDLDKALEFYIKSTSFDDETLLRNTSEVFVHIVQLLVYQSAFEKALEWSGKGLIKATNDEFIHQLYLLEIEILRELGQMDKAFEQCEALEHKLQRTSRNYGKLLQLKATIMDMIGKPGVIELVNQAKDVLLNSKDYEGVAEALSQGGIRHFIEGRLGDAVEYLENAVQFANQTNNKALMTKVMINLGIVYNQFGEREKSHVYFKNAIELSSMLANKQDLISIKINLGVSFLNSGAYNAALSELTDAKNTSQEMNIQFYYLLALMNLGDVYFEIGEFDLALEHYIEASELSDKLEAPIEASICRIGVVKVNIINDQFENIERQMNQSFESLVEIQEYSYVSLIGYTLTEYYIKKNDLKAAMDQIVDAIKYAKMADDNNALVKAYSKKLELFYRDKKDDYALFQEAIKLATKHNIHHELANLYLSRYEHREETEMQFLFKAKEMAMFFDRCYLTEKIENYILNRID